MLCIMRACEFYYMYLKCLPLLHEAAFLCATCGDKRAHNCRTLLQLRRLNPFVCLVRLADAAGAANQGLHPRLLVGAGFAGIGDVLRRRVGQVRAK